MTEEDFTEPCDQGGRIVAADISDSLGGVPATRSTPEHPYRMKALSAFHPQQDAPETAAPITECSAHYFEQSGSTLAAAWYGQGLRLIDASDARNLRQVGYYYVTGTDATTNPSSLSWDTAWRGDRSTCSTPARDRGAAAEGRPARVAPAADGEQGVRQAHGQLRQAGGAAGARLGRAGVSGVPGARSSSTSPPHVAGGGNNGGARRRPGGVSRRPGRARASAAGHERRRRRAQRAAAGRERPRRTARARAFLATGTRPAAQRRPARHVPRPAHARRGRSTTRRSTGYFKDATLRRARRRTPSAPTARATTSRSSATRPTGVPHIYGVDARGRDVRHRLRDRRGPPVLHGHLPPPRARAAVVVRRRRARQPRVRRADVVGRAVHRGGPAAPDRPAPARASSRRPTALRDDLHAVRRRASTRTSPRRG